jgi:hypothetical protein
MPAMRTIILIISSGLAALALGACGAEEEASGSGDREAKAREALLNFARCMRENGVDMPDPQVDEDGGVVIGARRAGGPGDAKAPDATFEKAEEKCRKHMEELKPPKLDPEQEREMREASLAHARCMRENGVPNFPDPTFGEGGGATIKIGPGTGLNPESPTFKRAQEKCREKLPFERGGDGPATEVSP